METPLLILGIESESLIGSLESDYGTATCQ